MIMSPDNKDWSEFVSLLGGPKGCNFRGSAPKTQWKCFGGDDKRFATAILKKTFPKVDIEKTLSYFEKHGGYCDCEILFNVESSVHPERFPVDEVEILPYPAAALPDDQLPPKTLPKIIAFRKSHKSVVYADKLEARKSKVHGIGNFTKVAIPKNTVIDTIGLKGDAGFNSWPQPNITSINIPYLMPTIAIRDIRAGEELLLDYGIIAEWATRGLKGYN